VIFDLAIGKADVFPTAEMGYKACLNASSQPFLEGNVGAGIGATIAKIKGMKHAMKAGVGSSCIEIGKQIKVAALVVLNALGEVIDPCSGKILAGVRNNAENLSPPFQFISTLSIMEQWLEVPIFRDSTILSNTTIGIVATNARLNKEEANKVAQMAHNGLARAIRPAHTMFDGDTILLLPQDKKKLMLISSVHIQLKLLL
jgi:L-aminopeptidase/D-esterase-like protein